MKLAQLELLQRAAGEPPVLLLDDVLSELDANHRRHLLSQLAERNAQVCITAADLGDLGAQGLSKLPIIDVNNGSVTIGD
jgi:DNA replication and repair protein RecF